MDTNPEKNILLIEKDAGIRSLLKDICAQESYKLSVSESWEAGSDLSFNISFNLIIIDFGSYGDVGEILNKLRQRNPLVCFVVLSDSPTVNSVIEAMRNGAVDYLEKPFTADQLKEAVLRALKHQRQETAKQRLIEEAINKEYYQRLSIIDDLTGVYNYRYFNDMLNRELARARRYPQQFSLLIIDVDEFKNYNDSKGHLEGDQLLKGLADFFSQTVRVVDMVFRYGGEEFAVVLPQTPKDGAIAAARRIINLFRKKLPVTISMGVSSFPDDGQSTQELVKAADHALYQAKSLGKNRICIAGRTGSVTN